MNPSVKVDAYAKINLGLCVTGTLQNGYHALDMVMQSVSLCDSLILEKEGKGSSLDCTDPRVPCGEENLCLKAVRLLEEKCRQSLPVSILLKKRIPSEAGLAGGSADGAAVLAGLNRLYSLGLSDGELLTLAASLGADVPFCLTGGTKRVKGFGERVFPLPPLPPCFLVLAKPEGGVSTRESFARFDALAQKPRLSLSPLLDALDAGDMPRIANSLVNALEPCADNPQIPLLLSRMRELGALGSRMTGSGSAVFGMFLEEDAALACQRALKQEAPFCMVCRPETQGLSLS